MSSGELSNLMTGALLSYVRRVGGEDKVAATLELAGETRSLDELCDPSRWGSYDSAHALYSAAVLVMNDPDIGRRAGEEIVATPDGTGLQEYLRSLGGPIEVISLVAQIAPKISGVTEMETLAADECSALVSARTSPSITRDRIFCGFSAGVLSRLSWLYGMDPAGVTEIQCQTRGDPRCLYKVAWDPTTRSETDPQRHIEYLQSQVSTLTDRIESLEFAAADLAVATDTETVLQTIIMRASLAARGYKYVLAVRLPEDDDLRVHQIGCADVEARVRATEILSARTDEPDPTRLIVDIASGRHHFGRLAVFYPEGYAFLPHEHRELRAYAGHAAAVLETAAALDESRLRNATLSATLETASAVANARSSAEVAASLARGSTIVMSCERACVLLWEPHDEIFTCAATFDAGFDATAGGDGTGALASRIGPGAPPPPALRAPQLAARFCRSGEPVVAADHADDPLVARILALTGMRSAVLMPISVQSELLGVLAVGSTSNVLPPALRTLPGTALRERLTGIASIGASALKNARLLSQLEYEALHDPLTTLPNTRLLQDEIVRALSHADRQDHQAAVLFVDLDRFEAVNDSIGHVAADDVLRAVGLLLRSAVRRGDVVARLSGDQFAVLLPFIRDASDAALVAHKVISTLAIPFDDFDRPVSVSASIGVAVFPDHGRSYDELLGHADAAMRQAKAAGGNRLVISSRS